MTEPVAKPAPFRFGVSQFTTTPWSFEQDIEEYARLGVDTVEVCEFKLDAGRDRAGEQLSLIPEAGLEISSVQPAVRTLYPSRTQPHPENLDERMDRFRDAIELAAPFAPGVPFVCNTGPSPKGNVRDAIETAARKYRALADFAGTHGVKIALEPLNPVLMNVESAIWTLAQAMRVVEAVDRENFGVCVDNWNIWQNENVVEERAKSRRRPCCGLSTRPATRAPTRWRSSPTKSPTRSGTTTFRKSSRIVATALRTPGRRWPNSNGEGHKILTCSLPGANTSLPGFHMLL
ncbi:MAG: sugar phosphate isomerase/epimerase family protein [Rubrobacteraceae bacterium]